jgi:hypothetical protein
MSSDTVANCRKNLASFAISWQLAEAATSAATNYQEAKAAYPRKEFAVKTGVFGPFRRSRPDQSSNHQITKYF